MNAPRRWIGRQLLNAAELQAWAEDQGFSDLVPSAWHVTLGVARPGIEKLSERTLVLPPDRGRAVRVFGGLVVLEVRSQPLKARGTQLSHFSDRRERVPYRPHISFTPYRGERLDTVRPFAGELRLGPEKMDEFLI